MSLSVRAAAVLAFLVFGLTPAAEAAVRCGYSYGWSDTSYDKVWSYTGVDHDPWIYNGDPDCSTVQSEATYVNYTAEA